MELLLACPESWLLRREWDETTGHLELKLTRG